MHEALVVTIKKKTCEKSEIAIFQRIKIRKLHTKIK